MSILDGKMDDEMYEALSLMELLRGPDPVLNLSDTTIASYDLDALLADAKNCPPPIYPSYAPIDDDDFIVTMEREIEESRKFREEASKITRIKVTAPAWRVQLMKRRNKYYIRRAKQGGTTNNVN